MHLNLHHAGWIALTRLGRGRREGRGHERRKKKCKSTTSTTPGGLRGRGRRDSYGDGREHERKKQNQKVSRLPPEGLQPPLPTRRRSLTYQTNAPYSNPGLIEPFSGCEFIRRHQLTIRVNPSDQPQMNTKFGTLIYTYIGSVGSRHVTGGQRRRYARDSSSLWAAK